MNAPAQGNWLNRNWKWFVPVGCLTMLAIFAGGLIAMVIGLSAAMKSSDVYTEAIARARSNAAVVAALGEPIEEGLMLSGQLNVSGPSGDADLAVAVSGPKGEGKLYIVGAKSAGKWSYSALVVELQPGGERIDLLEAR